MLYHHFYIKELHIVENNGIILYNILMKDNLLKIHPLFSIFTSSCTLNIDNKPIIKYGESLRKKEKGRIRSNSGGWQSNNLPLDHKLLTPLIREIEEYAFVYCQSVGFKKNIEYKIGNIWMNINGYKDSNLPHIHPNSVISGAYYLKTPKDCGNIGFINPSQHLMDHTWLDTFKDSFTEINSALWFNKPEENVLFLFPSWLLHLVQPNMNKKENRISISFNIEAKLL